MSNAATKEPPKRQQPFTAAVGSAKALEQQGYTSVSHNLAGEPDAATAPDGTRVTVKNGVPQPTPAQQQQQAQRRQQLVAQARTNGILNAQFDANENFVSGISAKDGSMIQTVNGQPQSDGRPNPDRLKQAQAQAARPAAAPARLTADQQNWQDNFGHPGGTPDHPFDPYGSQRPPIPSSPLPGDVAVQADLAHRAAAAAGGTFTPSPSSGPSPATLAEMRGTADVGQQLQASRDAQAAADAAYTRQHPGPPDAAHGGYGALPAIPGETQTSGAGGGIYFGPNGPQTVAPGVSVTSLPGNRTILGGPGFNTRVQSGTPATDPTQETSRTVGPDGTVHIRLANGGQVDAPAGTPVASGNTDTGIYGEKGQQIVRTAQGNLAPGTATAPVTPTAPVTQTPNAMVDMGRTDVLPTPSFNPIPTSSRPQASDVAPIPGEPASGPALALGTGAPTSRSSAATGPDLTPRPLANPMAPSYTPGATPGTGTVTGGVMKPSDFAEPASGAGPISPGARAGQEARTGLSRWFGNVVDRFRQQDAGIQRSTQNFNDAVDTFVTGTPGSTAPATTAAPSTSTPDKVAPIPATPAAPAAPAVNPAATGAYSSTTPTATTTSQLLANASGYGADSASQSAQPAPVGKPALYKPGQPAPGNAADSSSNTLPTSTAAQTLDAAPGYGMDPASQSAQAAPLGKSALYKPAKPLIPGESSNDSASSSVSPDSAGSTSSSSSAGADDKPLIPGESGSASMDTSNPFQPAKLTLGDTGMTASQAAPIPATPDDDELKKQKAAPAQAPASQAT